MAMYKNLEYLGRSDSAAFDTLHAPGAPAPHAGVYRCEVCAKEIGIASGHTLPPQNHHQHPEKGAVRWRMIVYADHRD
jgi:hypothetical protein